MKERCIFVQLKRRMDGGSGFEWHFLVDLDSTPVTTKGKAFLEFVEEKYSEKEVLVDWPFPESSETFEKEYETEAYLVDFPARVLGSLYIDDDQRTAAYLESLYEDRKDHIAKFEENYQE